MDVIKNSRVINRPRCIGWQADNDNRNEFLNSKTGRALFADEE